ncbi:dATP/dGTP diphosphohydrolase domain-containing protein [Marinobacter sp. X15-166B]|uniref:dATP/dGTP diphosphohydrolase domain-containing protein n=1 Tax=Marinobacter sp. X15-166B TaxID=1897620 RepID=UPI0009424B1D|nr:dATP/dGTP diphosphohydrolase domain-containing protein [Marinobacter sp. X15-166B]
MDIIGQNGNDGDHYEDGVKYDAEKPEFDLIPPLMELEVAKVLTVGAQKYSPDNWRRVPDLRRRYISAARRHINALQQGITYDDETGLHHAAHAVCCLMFLGEVELEAGGVESAPFA